MSSQWHNRRVWILKVVVHSRMVCYEVESSYSKKAIGGTTLHYCTHSTMMLWVKVIGSVGHGLNSLKLWAPVWSLLSYSTGIFCHNHEGITNTEWTACLLALLRSQLLRSDWNSLGRFISLLNFWKYRTTQWEEMPEGTEYLKFFVTDPCFRC